VLVYPSSIDLASRTLRFLTGQLLWASPALPGSTHDLTAAR